MSKQGQITLDMQITGSFALFVIASLLIVNKHCKFQMDTFLSVFEKWTLTKKINRKLNRPRPDADADAGLTTIARLFFE